MATLLLFVIYVSFIGLGIPDSLLGTAWPAIYKDLGLPISYAGFVSAVISIGTICSSLLSAKLIAKLGVNLVTAFSTLLTALALLAFSFTNSMWLMLVLAIPLGVGAGCIDVALNDYVAVNYSASQMNFLHCFYGVGVSVSPFIMSLVIESSLGWRGGYRIAFIVQLVIAVLAFLTLGVWSKVQHNKIETSKKPKPLSLLNTFKQSGVKLTCLIFILATSIEFTVGNWGSTYLVEAVGLPVDRAATFMMTFYLGIALSRLCSGFLSKKLKTWTLIFIGVAILCVALLTLLFSLTVPILSGITVFFVGFGIGPIFPNLTHLTPIHFGKEISQSVIGVQMAFCNLGVMLAPIICGLLSQLISVKILPIYTLALFVAFVISILFLRKTFRDKTEELNDTSPSTEK